MLWVVVPTHGQIEATRDRGAALDLAAKLTSARRILPVFTSAPGTRAPYYDGKSIVLPHDRGTAAEILLALHRIETVDPEAMVVILPPGAASVKSIDVAISSAIERAKTIDRCVLVRGPASVHARMVVDAGKDGAHLRRRNGQGHPWTGVLVAPLPRLLEVFRESASWLVRVVQDFFGSSSPLLPRTLEELFRILPRRELEDLLVRARQAMSCVSMIEPVREEPITSL